MKHHSWTWVRTWAFWRRATKVCVRCGARLRMERVGPRKGRMYSYQEPGSKDWKIVPKLPECAPPTDADLAATSLDQWKPEPWTFPQP